MQKKQGQQQTPKQTKSKIKRRVLLKRALGASAIVAALPNQWVKPVVNSIVVPVHAQTSPPPPPPPPQLPPPPIPEDVCPVILLGNITTSSSSGTPPVGEPFTCSVTFDVLSMTDTLTITDVTNTALEQFNTLEGDRAGAATTTAGPRLVWSGEAPDAPFCGQVIPVNEVVITVTATCDAAEGGTFTQDFSLTEVFSVIGN